MTAQPSELLSHREELLTAASEYLVGRMSFQELHTLALDLAPEFMDDPLAAEMAARVIAADVEAPNLAGQELAWYRREAVKNAVTLLSTFVMHLGHPELVEESTHSASAQTVILDVASGGRRNAR